MYFNKYPLSHNFSFAKAYGPVSGFRFDKSKRPVQVTDYGHNIFRITVEGEHWERNYSQVEFTLPADEAINRYQLTLDDDAQITLAEKNGETLIQSRPGATFGKNGDASLFRFIHRESNRYYGAGSKMIGLEYTGKQSKFWNTDAMADFPPENVQHGTPDPYYVSIPYLIIKTDNGWVGLLLNNPEATFMSVAADMEVEGLATVSTGDKGSVILGAESGQPDLFLLAASSLPELTRHFQQLVGTTPLPPLWAIGYQQCRWGYESARDLEDLEAQFKQHEIPVDGLWLDIGYMDGYRVFTVGGDKFDDPATTFQKLLESGHPVVPIIDPGVKREPGYAVYDSGVQANIFCKNPEGHDFVGLVWPGLTVFPDFSREDARAWWAEKVEAFARQGLIGAWLDMNDPSVGSANPYDMRFGNGGKERHESFHNQYGMAMARATRKGFENAHPNQRIFLLTRSNFLGGARYAAVWTGDNVSNYHYLRHSVATSINLALSGIPFNGGDIGGFDGNTTPELLCDWMKAAFLSPFCRNHSIIESTRQEPWAFDENTLDVCRNFIRLRYRLMPYLYNLFVEQAATGEAILRPLFYDFDSTEDLNLDRIDDCFLIGSSILQAPFLDESSKSRTVPLPGEQGWFNPFGQEWHEGNQRIESVARKDISTPLYLQGDSIIPLRTDSASTNRTNLNQVNLLIVARPGGKRQFTSQYQADDGITLDYQEGVFSKVSIEVDVDASTIDIRIHQTASGHGEIQPRLTMIADFDRVTLNGQKVDLEHGTLDFAGTSIPVQNFTG